ncbi:hypothetical protein N0V93_000959 [Gnomoniopsis smithogilvyi]|uniref:Cytochrome P450 n=1 Tax=Gnomoniopsis smithogilvyi TaxID=1191159 RepID=A0A9W9D184_9PEZI|nr:hypothetical protein N0V93_000959 [Gnomoniopsis smithogilvyi]
MGIIWLGTVLFLSGAFAYLTGLTVGFFKTSVRPPLPPGPKGLPFIGSIHALPPSGEIEARHWLKHKKLYGPISSVKVLDQTIIIVNDADLAFEILEKRSAKHSSRPRQVFAGEMMGWENALAFIPYNDRFRAHRKNMSRIIGSQRAVSQFNELQEAEVGHFLLHVLQDPDKLITEHIRRETGAVILNIVYGYNAERIESDPLIDMAGDAMDKFAKAAVPGAFMVDILPFLRNLPSWLPGTGFKQLALQWGSELRDVTEKPYAFVKHQKASGKPQTSFLSRLIDAGDGNSSDDFINKWSAMSLYVAGADTTVAALSTFFLAMITNPDAQRKAQEEIDRLTSGNRLPVAADRESLVFVDAIVKETLRWGPVAPMALPHTSTEDDVWEGYLIPKDAIIMANVWHFTQDANTYPDPLRFKPERFLKTVNHEPEADPRNVVFGFGRRICPGRLLADTALFLNIAQSLAVFNISKPLNVDGTEIEPEIRWESGVVSHPAPFKVKVSPRSEGSEKLIRAVEGMYPWQDSDAEILNSMMYEK